MPSWCAWRWRRCCWAPLRASLAADVLRAAGAPVPLSAEAAGLAQAGQGGRTADLPGHLVPGHVGPVAGGRPAAARRDPVPCGTSRQTVRYSDLAGLANY